MALDAAVHDDSPALEARRRCLDLLGRHEVGPGQVVGLVGPNDSGWMAAYAALREVGAVVLLLDGAAPAPERERWLARAGARRVVLVDDEGGASISPGEAVVSEHEPGSVLLTTSGTTGEPQLVVRSPRSLEGEGLRHLRWAALATSDSVLLALPMWHAYGLGWVHAAVLAGCAVTAVAPTALSLYARAINGGATVVTLVPTTARLLAARAARTIAADHKLRLAMVGTGPVDDELDAAFRRALGIGLARNYGSTETGALFSGAAGIAAGCVGQPLEGVELELLDDAGATVAAGSPGEVAVRVDGGSWRRMGDLGVVERDGLRLLGRTTSSIRRGDRWVAPAEIEAALRRHPDVVDALAFSCPAPERPGATMLRARIVHASGPGAATAGVHEHAHAVLGSHKVPHRIDAVSHLPKTPLGKPRLPCRVVLGPAGTLVAAAQAYKRTELLFALERLGVLGRLATGPATATELAAELGLDADVCEQLVLVAEDLGLLVAQAAAEGAPPAPDATASAAPTAPVIGLEAMLSRSWVTREELEALARAGMASRRFDAAQPGDALRAAYDAVMHGPGAYRRTALGLSLVRGDEPRRVLEITCGPGRYAQAMAGDGVLLQVGGLSGAPAPAPRNGVVPDGGGFDVVVVCNAVHLPGPGSDLRLLARSLRPGGRLLIDDVFLDAPEALHREVRLDWLTHGGLAWQTEADLELGLAKVGLTADRTVHVGRPACSLVLATLGTAPGATPPSGSASAAR